MPACVTYRPQQQRTAYHCGSVGASSAGSGRTCAYSYSTSQTAYTQYYSTSNYTAPQKLGWMSTSNQLLTGNPMAEMELHHSADAHLLAAHRPSGTSVRYALYAGGQRAVADHYEGGRPVLVRLHLGDAEVDIDPRTDRRTHRLRVQSPTGVAAVIESDGQSSTASYIHTDFQGSWVLLTDAEGRATARQAFDAWGRPRCPHSWVPLPEGQGISMPGQRGYTGHEHLPSLGLIHMNGRVYAPSLQRFLSPDPVLQAPANAQSHNRYAYCLNNPLRYTDPSGYTLAPAVPVNNGKDLICDPEWGGGWARAMTPGMTYGWLAGLPAEAYGPAFYAYFGSDGSRNAPPSSHYDYVYGAGGERGRVEWKYRWETKPGKIQADGTIEVIGYKEWYMEWRPAGGNVRQNRSEGVWTVGATATVAAGLLGVKIAIGLAISRETIRPYVTIEHAIGVDVSAGIEIEHYTSLLQNKISVSELKGWSESTNIGLWIMDGTIGGDVKKGGLLLQDRVEWVPQNNYNVFGIGFSIGSPFGFTRNKGYTWIW